MVADGTRSRLRVRGRSTRRGSSSTCLTPRTTQQIRWLQTPRRSHREEDQERPGGQQHRHGLLCPLKDVAHGLGVPLTTASRRDTSGVQCRSNLPQRRCTGLLGLSDNGQDVCRVSVSLSLYGGHCATPGHMELRITPAPVRGKFDVLREIGNLDEAAKLLDASRARFPDDPALASSHAELLEGKSDWLSALSAYDGVIKNFPRAFGARLGRARILRRINKAPDALETYSSLLAAQPYSAAAQLGKAATLIELKDFANAEKLLQHPHTPKSLVARFDQFAGTRIL